MTDSEKSRIERRHISIFAPDPNYDLVNSPLTPEAMEEECERVQPT